MPTSKSSTWCPSGGGAASGAEAAMEVARAAGADHFELTTAEADEAARSLYESFGMTNREGGPNGPRMLYYELDL
jgi:ribosomal protein S18 acetylase RimI-like enzyme